MCLMMHESPGLVRRNKIEIMKEILKQMTKEITPEKKGNTILDWKGVLCAKQDETTSHICIKLWHFDTLKIKKMQKLF